MVVDYMNSTPSEILKGELEKLKKDRDWKLSYVDSLVESLMKAGVELDRLKYDIEATERLYNKKLEEEAGANG